LVPRRAEPDRRAVAAIASARLGAPGLSRLRQAPSEHKQALASVALRQYAPSSVVAAYSLGQQLVLAAFDVTLGSSSRSGWRATREAA
jgi:hypothetical protein